MTYLYLRCGEGQTLTESQHALLAAEKPERVFIETADSPSALDSLLSQLTPGDCVVAERFADLAGDSRGFLELLGSLNARGAALRCVREGFDTRTEAGAAARDVLFAVAALDGDDRHAAQREGIERAREAGKYKGRKPISVDDEKLAAVAARWRAGEITAREAMQELGLKPNTFYRRIKAKSEEAVKGAGAAAAEAVKDIKEGVSTGAGELREAAGRVIDAAKDGKVGDMVREAGDKVREAAGAVVAAAKESKVGERLKEAAEDVVEGVRDAELGKKVKEGIETACDVVSAEIELRADQLRRDVSDAKARAELHEEVRRETEAQKEAPPEGGEPVDVKPDPAQPEDDKPDGGEE